VASFLHVTDLHFGRPDNSVGIGKSWKALRASGALPPARSLRTVMATHDRDVAIALTDLIVELRDQVDAVVVTGDIATTSAPRALKKACEWLTTTATMAGRKRVIALPGNHDRFHRFWPYAPGAVGFETAFAARPTIEVPAPVRGMGAVSLDEDCLLVCVDLTLEKAAEATRPGGSRAQGLVRRARDVTDAVAAARTPQTTHVVVATHFPLDPLSPPIEDHECINGPALRAELVQLALTLPVLLISGHLHREKSCRHGDLFSLVGATASQALHPANEAKARPADLTQPGAHAVVAVQTEPGGFIVTRWRYGEDVTLGQTPRVKRFCEPTEIHF
jgi:calcineurin-like phosphoesterase family protein